MNTKITYLYRDASNYKNHGEEIIAGTITTEDLRPYLIENTWFDAAAFGLPELYFTPKNEDDHLWHELISCTPTPEPPTIKTTSTQILTTLKTTLNKKQIP
ncbi:hypothetical protein KKF34_08985 [Myxococcota bacterium]|nr:hypothetical protein [Myxococcota bacterium]MBU1379828.1 hypothetical protein [Myxococcota bacterium]MBU1496996.1 hypothetical protein [Myxococcota bacterium]